MVGKNDRITEYVDQDAVEELTPVTETAYQKDFYKMPKRFGNIPIDELPLGCDPNKQYYQLFPRIALPFQKADKVSFGHPKLNPNRLLWGDNLHVLRLLPSNSVDMIYIDPPFFSGANYNVIFGDQNEIRSFTDIWEGGMPSYLIWLNARLLEMKRVLKTTGCLYIHLDSHASHYVKIQLDKIFGYDNLNNEIIWNKGFRGTERKSQFQQAHDTIFYYTKSQNYIWNQQFGDYRDKNMKRYNKTDEKGNKYALIKRKHTDGTVYYGKTYPKGKKINDVIDIPVLSATSGERIGYPTQKPEALLEKLILTSTNEGDVVADFFCGGGGTPTVAQKLGRRWIACDQSRVAVAITQGRLESLYEKGNGNQGTLSEIPDISVEYWGTYEIPALEKLSDEEFRDFIVSAYGGRSTSAGKYIHGYKKDIPLFVGSIKHNERITKEQVLKFAQEITETKGKYRGIMLAWAFAESAKMAVEKLKDKTNSEINLIQISLTGIDSADFKKHITKLHKEYETFVQFILPPSVIISHKRIKPMLFDFDASESMVLNTGAKIVNIQWDFNFQGRFTPTKGFAFGRNNKAEPLFKVQYKFEYLGNIVIACRVQDDLGGENIHEEIISVR